MIDYNQAYYRGPVFIIGMPRSGTKLLRDVLNRNAKVAIMEIESHFIPYMVHVFGDPPEFGSGGMNSFIHTFKRTTFYLNMVRIEKRDLDPTILYPLKSLQHSSVSTPLQGKITMPSSVIKHQDI